MHTMNGSFPRLHHPTPPPGGAGPARRPGLIAKVLGGIAGLVLLAAVVLASAVVLVLVLAVGLAALCWFWWQTRAVRRALREQLRAGQPGDAGARARDATPAYGPRAPLARRQVEVEDAEIVREESARDRPPCG